MNKPDIREVVTLEEFRKHMWFREEMVEMCHGFGIDSRGNRQQLIDRLRRHLMTHSPNVLKGRRPLKPKVMLNMQTPLLECNFELNSRFREYFALLTGVVSFRFTREMTTEWLRVQRENDRNFTIRNMLDVYSGNRKDDR